MRNPSSFLLLSGLLLGLLYFSCQQNHSSAPALRKTEAGEAPAPAEATDANFTDADAAVTETQGFQSRSPQQAFQTAVAVISRWDTLKKLVRTAELGFRTPDVLRATLAIEDIARQNGGFVLENNLTESTEEQYLTPVRRDSSMETTLVQMRNTLVLRVPHTLLDTTLRAIGHWAEKLDYRRVRAEDISLRWLEEQLAVRRNRQYQSDLQSDLTQRPGKLNDAAEAREKALAGRAAADAAQLEQWRLDDAVQLSTVKLELYQRPVIRRAMVANPTQIAAWRPGLGQRLWEAVQGGWRGLSDFFVFVLRIWPLCILVAGLWWLFRNRVRGARA